jgi:hypothetical protein
LSLEETFGPIKKEKQRYKVSILSYSFLILGGGDCDDPYINDSFFKVPNISRQGRNNKGFHLFSF